MKNIIFAAFVCLGLVACGGGGTPDPASSELLSARPTTSPSAARQKDSAATLVAQEISRVNTTTAGQQSLRSIGALPDGGYIVAWISNNDALYMQRYDSAGRKAGGETLIPLATQPGDNIPFIVTNSSMAVLADGSVVVAYTAHRNTDQPNGTVLTHTGIYIQRFDATGAQVLAETELASITQVVHRRSPNLGDPRVLALADGGFVAGWTFFDPNSVAGVRNTFFNQRFDSQNRPLTAPVVIGQPGAISSSYSFSADLRGGYVLSYFEIDPNNFPRDLVTVTHYDANQTAKIIVRPTPSPVLLLPLEGDRYVLYATSSQGPYRQFLDSEGNPVGEPTPVSAMPNAARELVDGSYVVFRLAQGNFSAQRFDGSEAPMGDLLPIQTNGAVPRVVALADGGFAMAWSRDTAPNDLDVYTQRFIDVLDKDQAARRAKRKACLDDAKGMTGHDRKAFMESCLAA